VKFAVHCFAINIIRFILVDIQNAFKHFRKYWFIDFISQIIGFFLTYKITVEVRTDTIFKESLVSQN